METARFDALVRSVARPGSRRAALLALGAGLAALGPRQAVLACKENGAKCRRKQAAKCCSGTCEKKNGERRCAKAEGAFGCTNAKATDTCREGGGDKRCPNNPMGNCVVDQKRRPFCAGGGACFACETDQDCRDELGSVQARCIKGCATCGGVYGNRLCVLPVGVEA